MIAYSSGFMSFICWLCQAYVAPVAGADADAPSDAYEVSLSDEAGIDSDDEGEDTCSMPGLVPLSDIAYSESDEEVD